MIADKAYDSSHSSGRRVGCFLLSTLAEPWMDARIAVTVRAELRNRLIFHLGFCRRFRVLQKQIYPQQKKNAYKKVKRSRVCSISFIDIKQHKSNASAVRAFVWRNGVQEVFMCMARLALLVFFYKVVEREQLPWGWIWKKNRNDQFRAVTRTPLPELHFVKEFRWLPGRPFWVA